jgi:N-acyl-D-aspartate/D-glutamate deacylase
VYLAFRDVTDWATEGNDGASFAPGWWVTNVTLGGSTISDGTSLAGWKSTTEVHPVAVNGFTVQLVAISSTGAYATAVAQVPLDSNFSANLGIAQLRQKVGDEDDVVAAIVTYDEPTETITDYAPYTSKANGVTQPGGGM